MGGGWVLSGKDEADGGILAKPDDYTLVSSSVSARIRQDDAVSFWLPVPLQSCCVSGGKDTDANSFGVYTMRPNNRGIEASGVSVGAFSAQTDNTIRLLCLKNNSSYFTASMSDLGQIHALLRAYARTADASQLEFHKDNKFAAYGVGIKNNAGKSGYMLDTGTSFSIVAGDYLGESGPRITYNTADGVTKVAKSPGRVKSAMGNFVKSMRNEPFGEEGPTGA
ncbi:hypothetical protein MLD38_038976 [Melastoma candidum]|uniref:Uncharacterized protein n=1 Tax=Melastoma candidum TaxID=119954 RepID=A0ACB9L1N5_9MYRT|nr:hypothetical protein MLD38_038976 [Melastoma candidum]